MALQRFMPWLALMLVVSIAGMAFGAYHSYVWLLTASAGAFSLWAIGIGITINRPFWRLPAEVRASDDTIAAAFRQNVRLMSMVYLWASFAMQTLYTTSLTGLRWQHGWQYAALMFIFALGAYLIAQMLGIPNQQLRAPFLASAAPLTIATALLSAVGLLFLVFSGKLAVRRADWAANIIFLFGAITVMLLAAMALRSHDKLWRVR